MKDLTILTPTRGALAIALATFMSVAAVQANAASPGAMAGGYDTSAVKQSTVAEEESGTIPAARPGLPQVGRGAQGPIRSDKGQTKTDPSIRDTNPLTMNGLWEMLPGNRIGKPEAK